jgi:hypothetical protein
VAWLEVEAVPILGSFEELLAPVLERKGPPAPPSS